MEQQAAQRLGTSESTVRRRIQAGKLPAEFRGGRYLIKEESLSTQASVEPLVPERTVMGADIAVEALADLPLVFDVDGLASVLGLSRDAVYRAVRRGDIPSLSLSTMTRFS